MFVFNLIIVVLALLGILHGLIMHKEACKCYSDFNMLYGLLHTYVFVYVIILALILGVRDTKMTVLVIVLLLGLQLGVLSKIHYETRKYLCNKNLETLALSGVVVVVVFMLSMLAGFGFVMVKGHSQKETYGEDDEEEEEESPESPDSPPTPKVVTRPVNVIPPPLPPRSVIIHPPPLPSVFRRPASPPRLATPRLGRVSPVRPPKLGRVSPARPPRAPPVEQFIPRRPATRSVTIRERNNVV